MRRGTARDSAASSGRRAALLALAALVAGCAQMVPQTVGLRTGWPAGVPQSTSIPGVPFFPQDDYQCGPAALATVLAFSSARATAQSLVPQVWLPGRQGTLQLELLAAARRHDRIPYVLAPRYADVLREVGAGNPVLVLQDVGVVTTRWHYAVVTGFDYPSGTVWLNSGTREHVDTSFTALERSWMPGGNWAMVALAPDHIPATATEDAWMNAVLAMARVGSPRASATAFTTALARWPDNLTAAIGLANQLHAQGDVAQAAAVLREARRRHPDSTIVANNLAQALSDLGQNTEALALLDPIAADPANPFAADVRATRDLILGRLKAPAGPRAR